MGDQPNGPIVFVSKTIGDHIKTLFGQEGNPFSFFNVLMPDADFPSKHV